jgi:hypothetical protein
LWAVVSLLFVPAAKLSSSYIPHLLVARSVQGEAGRAMMGVVVIAGSVAAVNTLFKSLADLFAGFGSQWCRKSERKWVKVFERPGVWIFFITAAVGLMMAVGMAGTEDIDLFVRIGFVLWIFYYGGINFSVLVAKQRISSTFDWKGLVFPAIGTVVNSLGAGALLMTDSSGGILLKYFLILIMMVVMGALAILFFKKKHSAMT